MMSTILEIVVVVVIIITKSFRLQSLLLRSKQEMFGCQRFYRKRTEKLGPSEPQTFSLPAPLPPWPQVLLLMQVSSVAVLPKEAKPNKIESPLRIQSSLTPSVAALSMEAKPIKYKNELRKEDKNNLRILLDAQKHKLVTSEIIRELDNSCNRGEKEGDLIVLGLPVSVINRTIEEDGFDIPDVPMEED